MKYFYSIILLLIVSVNYAQNVFIIKGLVVDEKSRLPIENATVQFLPDDYNVTTNSKGYFQFSYAGNGKRQIVVSMLGYASQTLTFSENAALTISLQQRIIGLKDVIVTAKPRILGSSSVIDKSAIIHTQPTSLADVLQLIPGQLAINPNLGAAQQINLRQIPSTTDAGRANALGTQIIVDGVPISNNSNLQTDVTILNSNANALPPFSSVAGRGNDLRQIPADNIESIEVIRGIPSAKYGDLTSGLIIVNSRIGSFSPEVRVRLNPNLAQAAFFTGFANNKKNNTYNISVDLLNARDDVRDNFNKYTRVQTQVAWQRFWNSNKTFTTTTIASLYKSTDALKQNPEDLRSQNMNTANDNGIKLSTEGKWRANKKWITSLNYVAALTYSEQKGFYQSLITRDLFPISNAVNDTTQQGVYGKSEYLNQTNVDGKPFNSYVRAEAILAKNIAGYQNNFMLGTEWRYDANNGKGRQFDVLSPPRQNYSVGERPRAYSNVPGLHQLGYYFEDRITKNIGKVRWITQAGLRIDNVAPTDIFKSKYGLVAAPRINTAMEIANGVWLRGGYGIAAKSPTLNYLYPGIRYFDLVNFNYFATNPGERLVVVTTRTINLDDQNLKPYQSKKWEAGFDITKKGININVSFFQETTTGAIGINRVVKPFTYAKLKASSTPPNQPPILNPIPVSIDTFFAAYDVPVNNRYIQNQGIEYSIDLPEIQAIRTSLNITGAYIKTTSFDDGQFTDAAKAYSGNTTPTRVGIYQSSAKITAERLNSSVRLIHRIPQLNMVISALWQTIWVTKSRSAVLSAYPIGFINRKGETVNLNETDSKQTVYADLVRPVSNTLPTSYPPLQLFNIRLTKEWEKGFGFSFYANNFINNRPLQSDANTGGLIRRNEPLFFGAEFNMAIK
jgi:outer membrane receptor protein involved in Fe transport